MSAEPASGPPLAHLRVVDLTDLRGAFAGRMLADLGADVIKVEPPGGDPDRFRPPFAANVRDPGRSLPFLFRNLGKRGAVIDLDDAAGWRRFLGLCDGADVLIENLAPDDELAQRLGAVVRDRQHLVHASVADFGRSGPRSRWRLEPLPAFAASGALWASGFPDRAPCWLPGYQAHDCAAIVAVAGVLAALLDRARSGRGQTVEVSVQEAALAGFDPWGVVLADYARVYPGLPPSYPRDGDGPALVLPVADGHVRVLVVTPRQWRALLALLLNREAPASVDEAARHVFGRGTWGLLGAGLERLAERGLHGVSAVVGALARVPVGHQILPALHVALAAVRFLAGEALASRSRADVLAHGLRLKLPIAPIHSPEEFVAAEQTRARDYFRRTGSPPLGDAPVAVFPIRFSRTPVALRRPAPEPGEDEGDLSSRAAPTPEPTAVGGPVLAGLRVINLGVGAVIPELCGTLADLGAEVIKVESAASPDFLRRLTPEPGHSNRSFMFNDENRGQRSVCLDLRTPAGRGLALRLCATADVVAENRQGGLLRRFGLDYDAVKALRPDVIYVSSQGYGSGGPLGEAPAFGPLAAAFAGATFLWNHADAPYPGGSSLEHPDHMAGKLAAVAVLAALEHRRRSGEGQRIELAQSEAVAYLLGDVYLEEPLTGRRVEARGNAADYACPHGVYPASGTDTWVAIAAVGDDAWERMRSALGWERDERLATLAGRLAARAEIEARVATWTRGRSAENAATCLQSVGVSAMPVEGPEDLRSDAHLAARGALVTIEDPEIGPVRHVANPIRLSRTPLAPPRPAPRLGADTQDVLVRMLGLGIDEVRRLVADGVAR